jgi:hypothetical protein
VKRNFLKKAVWLASYPRSGNTFLRTILWHCFGLKSASVYPKDLGGNRKLEEYVGHIEHEPDGSVKFPPNALPLIKTHEYNKDNIPAIYVIRDGRAACVSLWKFYNRTISLKKIIEGRHQFGSWSNHVISWNPWERPKTLLLKYESMTNDLPLTLNRISNFLKCDIINGNIPDRNAVSAVDGKWVKTKKNWRLEFPDDLLKEFNQINKDILLKAGYLD